MLLLCDQLSKRFGITLAIDNLSLSIPDTHRAIGLIGANGAGKTTLFSLMTEHLIPSSGNIKIFEKPANDPELKGQIGILPQDAELFKGISIHKQFIHFAQLHGLTKTSATTEMQRVLDLVNMLDAEKKYPEQLSHGQRKRIMIAQALIAQPKLILLDEPTAGLDPVAANDIRELIAKLKQKHCLIISSHNLNEIEGLCDSVLILKNGKLVVFESLDELLHGNQTLNISLNTSIPAPLIENITSMPNIISCAQNDKDLTKLIVETNENDLEDVQNQLIQLISTHGLSIVELSRGSNLNQEVINLIKP